ncbi:hypothetical protein [Desulfobacula sp.]|uniref:hypothetical protein n=1 Tax=Desulfobacula sp. TaxID=2593537 RepID=UPI0026377011|nr:hypothetical protein [Desulfobacula sp.]
MSTSNSNGYLTAFPGYLTRGLILSDAFLDLKPASVKLLLLLFLEIKIVSKRKAGKYVPVITNRHDIKLPYAQIREQLGYTDKTVWTAFKDIFAHGFLEVVTHGGGAKGDINIYGISEDWRKWEQGQIIREMTPRNRRAGWQKGKK